MHGLICRSLVAVVLLSGALATQAGAQQRAAVHLIHGQWFDGEQFVATDFYLQDGVLTHHPRDPKKATQIDLAGKFVVPPYGDAHEHNFDGIYGTAKVDAEYMQDGIFYAQGMTDTTDGAAEVVAAHLVNTPTTPDVTYAHGGLTGVNGHPKEVYESLGLGFFYPATAEQRAQVVAAHGREGTAYWEIATAADLDAKWPKVLAAKPDLIKVYLANSASFAQATAERPELGEGIDPALVPLIVQRAHAAGLKVAVHINDAADFHVAVTAGADEMAHLPGYGLTATSNAALETLADADIALAAAHHVKAQATAGLATDENTPAADVAVRRRVQRDNLGRLKRAGVPILVGSDRYSQDSLHEADYLQALGVWTNAEMLRMWSMTTPQAIFPKRKIGCLAEGCEASFLVLNGNPIADWKASHGIADRWKQGVEVPVAAK
jgi:imidazolonepropionase-like amidohydrolase